MRRLLTSAAMAAALLAAYAAAQQRGNPPPQATAACAGKSAGAACSFAGRGGRPITGECRAPRGGGNQLACAPARRTLNSRGNSSGSQRAPRQHSANQSDGALQLITANAAAPAPNMASIEVRGNKRIIIANGIPAHTVGAFPNRGNPHAIAVRQTTYELPATPAAQARATPLQLGEFGVALNGVPFDPGAAEWYRGQRNSPWRYEALSGAVALGLDANHAHVQPSGKYHYHGMPTGLLARLPTAPDGHSPLLGWALDGFPIYAARGYANGKGGAVARLRSSYALKSGARPSGNGAPGGRYDGTFVGDYRYIAGSGDLDDCNGRQTITPEFPQGTYAYFLTDQFPVIPRCFRGKPVNRSQ